MPSSPLGEAAGEGARGASAWGPWTQWIAKTAANVLLLIGLAAFGTYITWKQPGARAVQIEARPSSSLTWLAPSEPELVRPAPGRSPLATQGHTAGPSSVQSGVTPTATPATAPAPSDGLTADGKVILNRAGVTDLRRLPGVGAKRAEAIIALRTKLGRFKSPHDLLRVRGIGPRMLRRWLPLLVLDANATPEQPQARGAALDLMARRNSSHRAGRL